MRRLTIAAGSLADPRAPSLAHGARHHALVRSATLCRSTDRTKGSPHEAAHRARRHVPLHGDTDHVRPRQRAGHLRATERLVRPVRRGLRPLRLEGRRAGADASAGRRGALRPRPPLLDQRPQLRSRLPHPRTSASPLPAASISWPNRSPASSVGRWTARVRCGRSMSSRAWRADAGHCSPSTTTPPSTGRPVCSCSTCSTTTRPTPSRPARARRGSRNRSPATSTCCG